jgi:hypothetical protein
VIVLISIPRQQLGAASHGEIRRTGAVRRERARLDVHAADGDAVTRRA